MGKEGGPHHSGPEAGPAGREHAGEKVTDLLSQVRQSRVWVGTGLKTWAPDSAQSHGSGSSYWPRDLRQTTEALCALFS